MPYFSRAQFGVILMLGAALLVLWGWRGNFGLSLTPPPTPILDPVYVEVTGPGARPGFFVFPHSPTLSQVLAQAGAAGASESMETKLSSGSKVEVTGEGQCRLGRMSGPQLLTLGLAIDINRANQTDLESLPGIGPVLARRILDFRQKHGPFKNIDDLEQVSGIGPKKLAQIKPYLFIAEIEDHD